jgi:hypothetical protein
MCWDCGCNQLEDDHHDARHLTTTDLEGAADASGSDIAHVVGNIVVALSHFNPALAKVVAAVPTPYAACRVFKSTEERHYTLGVAYPAMKPDAARAADGHRDFVSAEVLEKTAWEWMSKHRDINLFHRDGTSGHGEVVESYIYRGPDWTVPSPVDSKPYVVKAGDWLLGAIWDDYGWALVKSGLINGWSPEGGARRRVPSPDRVAQLRS